MFRDLPRSVDQQMTSMVWCPTIPQHWDISRNKALFTSHYEKVGARSSEYDLLSLTKMGVIFRDISSGKGKVPASFDDYQVLEEGDLIMCLFDVDETPRTVGRARQRGMITGAYDRFIVGNSTLAEYLNLFYKSVDDTKSLKPLYRGLRKTIPIDAFMASQVPVPPADEQAAIVKYLAHANVRIDTAIAAKRRLIALLREGEQSSKRAVFASLEAPVLRTKDVCTRIIDCKNRTPEFVEDGAFVVVRTTCVRDGRFSLEGSYPTDEANFEVWTQRGVPRVGDVLFTREAPAGEAAMVPGGIDLCLGQRMMLYRPDPSKVMSEFLLYAIYDEPARRFISAATNGSTVGHLRVGDVGAIPLRVPALSVQREAVDELRKITDTVTRAVERIDREVVLLREFRTRLVADVVTGQVDVRAVAATLPDAAPSATVTDEVLMESDGLLEDGDE